MALSHQNDDMDGVPTLEQKILPYILQILMLKINSPICYENNIFNANIHRKKLNY